MGAAEVEMKGGYEFDFHESFIAVIEKISRLARIDTHNTKKKLTTQPQCKRRLFLFHDGLGGSGDTRLKELCFRQLAFMGRKPDFRQRSLQVY